MTDIYVQFSDETETLIIGVFGAPQTDPYYVYQGIVQEDDPRYIAFAFPETTPAYKARAARAERERLLREVYDPGILMAQRAFRLASTPAEEGYATGKIAELDAYAELLLLIPEQDDFPMQIEWPIAPTK